MSALLVSVRNVDEALEAVAGGATIIDVKEPTRGPLGCADYETIDLIASVYSNRYAVSAAFGEFNEAGAIRIPRGVRFFKVGLAGLGRTFDWQYQVQKLRETTERDLGPRLVAVAYADWHLAAAPSPYDVMDFAVREQFPAFLVDTWQKDGSTLLKWASVDQISGWRRRCHDAGIMLGLAGSLRREEVIKLLPVQPDLFAVRGAACDGGRQGTVSRERVRELVALLSAPC